MKQIRSGQPFLYRSAGYHSTVMEIRMKDKVTGSYLQVALTRAAKRFPYLTDKLVEKDGNYYLHRDDNSMVAVKTDKFRTLGSMATGYHLLDVTYTKNMIRVAFHHGLCDGRGVKFFVETLLYYYCCQKYHKAFSAEGIRLEGEPISEEETLEPFSIEYDCGEAPDMPPVEKDGYALPESTSNPDGCYRTELLFDEGVFVQSAKSIGASPAIFAAMLLSECVSDLNPGAEKPIVCNMAMDLRSALGLEQTHRNCVGSAYLPFGPEERQLGRADLAQKYRQLLTLQREPAVVRASIQRQAAMFNKLDETKSLEAKKQFLSIFDGMVNNTYVVSYMGRLCLNDFADHVESAHFYSDTICGLTINMVSAGGVLSMQVLQGFAETRYVQEFEKALAPCGLLSAGETELIITGQDKSYITASRQAERWFVKPE